MGKKLIIGFLLFSFLGLQAQKMTYRVKAELFPAKGYKYEKGDKHDPTTATILSFLIPGVGQMYAGQPDRGGFQLLLASAFTGVVMIGVRKNNDIENISCTGGICKSDGSGQILVLLGLTGILTTSISSIIDANKV